MNKDQRKAMETKSGLSLIQALAGVKPMDEQDRQKLAEIKALHKPRETTPRSQKAKPDFSSGPRALTQQEIESLRKSNEETSIANETYFKKLLGKM